MASKIAITDSFIRYSLGLDDGCRIPRGKFSAGVRTIHVPWADLSRRVTYEFERWTIDLLEAKNHEELKHSRWALLKNEDKRTEKQDEVFKVIQAANFQVSIAWRLREEFKSIFGGDSYSDSDTYFDLWIKSVKKESIKGVTKVAEMFERHYEGVYNALCHQQSNGKVERINGKIQEIKTVSRGYRKFENFRSAVLFFCGGLDIYPQQCR